MALSGSATYAGRDPGTGEGLRVTVRDGLVTAVQPFADGGVVGAPGLADQVLTAQHSPLSPAGAGDLPWISAGLVDLQVNGFGGLDLNAGTLTVQTVAGLCRLLAAEGVTRFLPTIVTAHEEAIVQRLATIVQARASDPLVAAMVAGIHVEGPFISPLDGPRGAHTLACVRDADPAEIARWQEAAGGLIRIVTLAPEVPGALAAIEGAVALGITVSLGHSAATADQVHAAAEAGATMSTHLGNGIAATLPRHPNAIWAQLADDRLVAGIIADGHHLPGDTVKAMIRAKGPHRAVLVSDSVGVAGLPPGVYDTELGGRVEISASGRVSLAGTPYLAGSGQSLRTIIARAVSLAQQPLAEVLAMASDRAAASVGLSGGLTPGARADLVLFDWAPGDDALTIRQTIVAGHVAFAAAAEPIATEAAR